MAEPQGAYPEPSITRPRRRARVSLVWIVPIVALVAGALLLARTWQRAGPEITITFRNAEGLDPGRTEVRYKEVVVGRVTRVGLSPDRERVVVSVQLAKSVANLAVADTRFWVVRPRVGTAGISGLGTLFSGAYIGLDAGESETPETAFAGLEVPPFVLRGEPGSSFVLSAEDLGSLEVGSPVYYRRARVGRVVGFELDPQRDVLDVRVFIEAPNDRLVTRDSRFWNASGIDVGIGAQGVSVNAQTIASILVGGVAFVNPQTPTVAASAPAGHRFHMFDSRKAALAPPDGRPLRMRMLFHQSLRGLGQGSPVELLGVEIGNVQTIDLHYDMASGQSRAEVFAQVYPQRLGTLRKEYAPPSEATVNPDRLFMKALVEGGLRAQARTGNLLTGQLLVALDFVPRAAKTSLDEWAEVITIPTVPGALQDIQPQIAQIVARLSRVRFDEIASDVQGTLKGLTAAAVQLQETLDGADAAIRQLSPDAQRALADVRETLASMRGTLSQAESAVGNLDRNLTQSDSALQRNANQALSELQRAAQSLRVLGDYLQRHPQSLLRGKPADPDLPGGER